MKKEFIVNRQGKDFVLFAGLLDQAHAEGLKRISTTLIQAPADDNGHMAIVHAEVEVARGVFSGLGDADPTNVGKNIAPHVLRMAETRAKARALRDAINVGVTALEELADDEDGWAGRQPTRPSAYSQRQEPAPASQLDALRTLATELTALTGEIATVPAELTAPEAATFRNTLTHKLAAARVAHGKPTHEQLDKLAKLQAATGRPVTPATDKTAGEVAEQITELVTIWNTAQQATKAGAR